MKYGKGTIRQQTIDQIREFLEKIDSLPPGGHINFIGLPDPHLVRHRIYKYLNATGQKPYYQLHLSKANPYDKRPENTLTIYKVGPATDYLTEVRYKTEELETSLNPSIRDRYKNELGPKLRNLYYNWPSDNPLSLMDYLDQVKTLSKAVEEKDLSEEDMLEILTFSQTRRQELITIAKEAYANLPKIVDSTREEPSKIEPSKIEPPKLPELTEEEKNDLITRLLAIPEELQTEQLYMKARNKEITLDNVEEILFRLKELAN